MRIKTYSEMSEYHTLEERFSYLSLRGSVGSSTFGFDRYINQQFYRSREWKRIRNEVIIRDQGMDLGVDGYEIHGQLLIHHMNPMSTKDLVSHQEDILDPEFLITTTHKTHNAIHYGDERQLPQPLKARVPGDTRLW